MASQAAVRGWTTQVLKVSLTVLHAALHRSPTVWSMPLHAAPTQSMNDWRPSVMEAQAVARGWTTQVLKVSLTVLQVLVHQSPTVWSMPLQAVATQLMKDWKASVMEAQIWRPVSVWVKK